MAAYSWQHVLGAALFQDVSRLISIRNRHSQHHTCHTLASDYATDDTRLQHPEYVIDISMGSLRGLLLSSLVLLASSLGGCGHVAQSPLLRGASNETVVPPELFWELEQLARIVDISYCVGTAGLGIQKPFSCASRCSDRDLETFELVAVSCHTGYITRSGR